MHLAWLLSWPPWLLTPLYVQPADTWIVPISPLVCHWRLWWLLSHVRFQTLACDDRQYVICEFHIRLTHSTKQVSQQSTDSHGLRVLRQFPGKTCCTWNYHLYCSTPIWTRDKTWPEISVQRLILYYLCHLLTTTATYVMFCGEMVMSSYISPMQWCQACTSLLTFLVSTAFVPKRISMRTYRWHGC